jgi:CDP-diacylglycerol--glycerol-3-phosphate 3-phosphatidyltransferase
MLRYRTPEPRCGHRGCWDGWAEPIATVPNAITTVRTLASLALTMTGAATGSMTLLVVGLVVYVVGDSADGVSARLLRQETRRGALYDIVTDRFCSLGFWVPWAWLHPDVRLPIALYAVEFVLVDGPLSLLWAKWPLTSCNYVGRVDRWVWVLNWCVPAKTVNSTALILLIVAWPMPAVATALVATILVVKAASLLRLRSLLPAPGPGCAVRPGTSVRRFASVVPTP